MRICYRLCLSLPEVSVGATDLLTHVSHLKKLLWELEQIIWESNIKGSTDNKINIKIKILA